MAHLDSSYSSYDTFIGLADDLYATDLTALNGSGVSGTVLLGIEYEEGGGGHINVAILAEGATALQSHAQHVHGLFDGDGNPVDSRTPTLDNDTDGDGYIEVLEGVPSYGDVLVPLTGADGTMPVADDMGQIAFIASYAIDDAGNFVSPVTGTQYSFEDVVDVALREYVLHGMTVPAGIGAGTDGEVNGTGGYTPILPAASGEFRSVTAGEASDILAGQRDAASREFILTGGDDRLLAGAGDDTVVAGMGDDFVKGEGDNDVLLGNAGDDILSGGLGNDTLAGGTGADILMGDEGDDAVIGADGDDRIWGGAGDDILIGGNGKDVIAGGDGDDGLTGGAGRDILSGGNGNDALFGGADTDALFGGAGTDVLQGRSGDDLLQGGDDSDVLAGGADNDRLFGGAGDDRMSGGGGDDLLVGGAGDDRILGLGGDDIIGGGAGNDVVAGGAGRDEFHFDAGTGTDIITDFTQGEDVISLLDGGAVEFANSTEDTVRGDSDLSADDFDFVAGAAGIMADNDQQVLYSTGGAADLATGVGAAVEAYAAATDGTDSYLYYDSDWSDVDGRELIALINGVSTTMTVSDFDVY